ncbi:MAG: SLC13 family permease [Thermomicrobiales bacterium]
MNQWLVLAIVTATLILMLVRPWGIAEAWVAFAGAIVTLLTGAVPLAALPGVIRETENVLLFLAGMLLLTGIAERAGIFAAMAELCVRAARGNGRVLYVCLFLLGALVTATLSLDVTVIMLTPIIYALTSRRKLDPVPYLFGCVFVANTASLVLPISNLTNLLIYARIDVTFGAFVRVMWWPNLVALTANLIIFLWIFRRRIPERFAMHGGDDKYASAGIDPWLIVNGVVVTATLAAIFALGLTNRPLWWASLTGAGILSIAAFASGRLSARRAWHDLSPNIFVFIVSMTVVVDGFQRRWLDGHLLNLPASEAKAALIGVLGGAVGSNVVNNVPMTILALPIIERAAPVAQHALAYGTLIGTNIGPALTTYGSLATMLWLTLVRRRGIEVSTGDYLRVSTVTVPIVLLATSAALVLVLIA